MISYGKFTLELEKVSLRTRAIEACSYNKFLNGDIFAKEIGFKTYDHLCNAHYRDHDGKVSHLLTLLAGPHGKTVLAMLRARKSK